MSRKYVILWTGPALDDLRAIRDYVAQDKPSAARKLARTIRTKVRRLADHPRSGRLVPELDGSGYREVIVAPYRIVYEIRENQVVILRVWHSRQRLPEK